MIERDGILAIASLVVAGTQEPDGAVTALVAIGQLLRTSYPDDELLAKVLSGKAFEEVEGPVG